MRQLNLEEGVYAQPKCCSGDARARTWRGSRKSRKCDATCQRSGTHLSSLESSDASVATSSSRHLNDLNRPPVLTPVTSQAPAIQRYCISVPCYDPACLYGDVTPAAATAQAQMAFERSMSRHSFHAIPPHSRFSHLSHVQVPYLPHSRSFGAYGQSQHPMLVPPGSPLALTSPHASVMSTVIPEEQVVDSLTHAAPPVVPLQHRPRLTHSKRDLSSSVETVTSVATDAGVAQGKHSRRRTCQRTCSRTRAARRSPPLPPPDAFAARNGEEESGYGTSSTGSQRENYAQTRDVASVGLVDSVSELCERLKIEVCKN